ncbi:MAG: tetratricopeptide repeat protein [Candidatus Zixiibacteriota bacterium]
MTNKWTHVVFIVMIVAVSIPVFYQTLKFDFVADDWQLIYHRADYLKNWSNLKTVFTKPFPAPTYEPVPFYRPVVTLANFINYHLSGKTTFRYHLFNLGLHTLNAVLVYLLIFIVFKRELLSFLASIFFVLHPIHTSSVVWISGRTDLIACFFVLLVAILFMKRKDHTGAARTLLFIGSVISYLLAVLSKETMLAFPLFLLLWDYLSAKGRLDSTGPSVLDSEPAIGTEPPGRSTKNRLMPYAPFAVVAILYIGLRILVLGNLGTGQPYSSANLFQRLLTAFGIYFYYFKKFILPVNLNFSPRVLIVTSLFSLKFWGTLIFFALVLALGITLRKKTQEISFGTFWILITLLPVLNLVPVYASVKEWWAYVPSIGFCLILGRLAEMGVSWEKRWFEIKLPRRKLQEEVPQAEPAAAEEANLPVAGEPSMASQSQPSDSTRVGLSAKRKLIFRFKQIRFPERLLIKGGHALSLLFALVLISYALALQGRAKVFRKDYHLWTNTSKVAPYDVIAQNAIGDILKRKGVTRWAKMAFQRAVQADSNSAEAHNNFGSTLEMTGQDDSALVQIKAAIKLDPGYADAFNNLGIIYGKKMQLDSAIGAFKKAFELDPMFYAPCKNLGSTYSETGDLPKALEYYEMALKLAPTKEEAEAVRRGINQIRVRGYR